jgi:hypothetical protein
MPDAVTADASGDAAVAPNWGERCGNDIDDDGDGLVDEDCTGLFAGVYAPAVADDPALAAIEAAAGRPLSVLQTYHSMSAAGVARIAPDLAAIFARGQVAHLNIEPAGYTAAQYAAPAADPIAHDLAAMADAVGSALAAAPGGRVLLTFGAEMNGNWTDWGCLPAAQYIALYRAAHDAVDAALAARSIDPRRVRWAYGPNSTASANCGSAAGYYPGDAYVDLLGMSAYRSGSASVDDAVLAPMTALFHDLAYPAAWRHKRFVVLQTGSRDLTDRDAWIAQLYTADDRIAGIIYFDSADWAAPASSLAVPLPVADRGLDAIFAPYFRDVPYDHPAFPEIQWLREQGITHGCDAFDFCPDDRIRAADAMTLLANAGVTAQLTDPVLESDLAAALGTSAPAVPATRARAAVLLAQSKR